MKKVLAILLASIMLLACVPFSASAANDIEVSGQLTYDQSVTIPEGDNYIISGQVNVTQPIYVNAGGSLTIVEGGSIICTGEQGRIINQGTITVESKGTLYLGGTGTSTNSATLLNEESGLIDLKINSKCTLANDSTAYNYGTIKNIDRMTIDGDLSHEVTIFGSFSVDYDYLETYNRKDITVDFAVGYYLYKQNHSDLDYTESGNYTILSSETAILVPHGQKLYIMITPEDGFGDWVDVGRMQLTAGGQSVDVEEIVDNDRGVFCITPSNALSLGVYSTSYKDIVKLFDITLPRTDAYYVITKDGDVDEVTVEYGKMLSFRLVLSPDYDKSEPYVYVNDFYCTPDEYGYFDVTGPITTEGMVNNGGVQNDISITVMGVSANESQEMMGSLVGFIQEIFAVIEEIFSYFFGMFEDLGDLGNF